MIPSHLSRMDHWFEKKDRGRTLPCRKTLREYFETNVFVTTAGHFSTTALLHAVAELGVDRVMFSVDTPYENITEGATWIDTVTAVNRRDLRRIARDNALALFPQLRTRMRTAEVEKLQQNREPASYLPQAGFPASSGLMTYEQTR